jgi:hypothetical protein
MMCWFVDCSQAASFDMSYEEFGVNEVFLGFLVNVKKFYLDIVLP